MYVFKPYSDSHLSDSDRRESVVRFWQRRDNSSSAIHNHFFAPHAVRQNISLALVGSIFRLTVPKVFCEIMICAFCVSGIRDCFESGGIIVCVGKRGRDI